MKKRIGYLDMAKGLAIILVIIGHSSFVPLRAPIAKNSRRDKRQTRSIQH